MFSYIVKLLVLLISAGPVFLSANCSSTHNHCYSYHTLFRMKYTLFRQPSVTADVYLRLRTVR